VALSDPELVVETFRTGLSRHGNIRGCGLKTSADQAIRFRADLDVRLPNCFVRLIPYGRKVQFNLFLCGYFDSGYLGYEAAEGIDWVWEHRIDDLALFGI
ncbi:MAG: XamI family restriction endonuclease, partial [Gammaproteobacteria bacterium]